MLSLIPGHLSFQEDFVAGVRAAMKARCKQRGMGQGSTPRARAAPPPALEVFPSAELVTRPLRHFGQGPGSTPSSNAAMPNSHLLLVRPVQFATRAPSNHRLLS